MLKMGLYRLKLSIAKYNNTYVKVAWTINEIFPFIMIFWHQQTQTGPYKGTKYAASSVIRHLSFFNLTVTKSSKFGEVKNSIIFANLEDLTWSSWVLPSVQRFSKNNSIAAPNSGCSWRYDWYSSSFFIYVKMTVIISNLNFVPHIFCISM